MTVNFFLSLAIFKKEKEILPISVMLQKWPCKAMFRKKDGTEGKLFRYQPESQ